MEIINVYIFYCLIFDLDFMAYNWSILLNILLLLSISSVTTLVSTFFTKHNSDGL